MEHIANAQNEKISGGCEERLTQTKREGLESVRLSSQVNESQQITTSKSDSSREDQSWKRLPVRDTDVGKIFERIESLETRHIKYVRAHKSRLNARLDEASVEEEEFLQEANQIKSDLYHLAIAQQKANGNGHSN